MSNRWPDYLESPTAQQMGDRSMPFPEADFAAMCDLFDQMEREIRVHRKTFCEDPSRTHTPSPQVNVLVAIAAERARQIAAGYDATHDDAHKGGEIISASWGALERTRSAIIAGRRGDSADYIHLLTQAAAQIAAEIERVQRASPRQAGGSAMSTNKIIDRFERAVKANGYRTVTDNTEREYQAAKAELAAALSPPSLSMGSDDFELAARLIEDHAIQDTSAGKVLVPRQDGNRDDENIDVSTCKGVPELFTAPPATTVPCPCTLIEQDEDTPIGYPSLVCGICDGKGHTTPDQVTALACEMIKIASDVGEPEDPFAAWESISLTQSQNDQLRKALDPFASIGDGGRGSALPDDNPLAVVNASMPDLPQWLSKVKGVITQGDVRRARAALSAPEVEG